MEDFNTKRVEENQYIHLNLPSKGIKSIDRPPTTASKSKKRLTGGMEMIIKGISVVVILSLWYLVTKLELVSPTLFPSPASTWRAFTELLAKWVQREYALGTLGA